MNQHSTAGFLSLVLEGHGIEIAEEALVPAMEDLRETVFYFDEIDQRVERIRKYINLYSPDSCDEETLQSFLTEIDERYWDAVLGVLSV